MKVHCVRTARSIFKMNDPLSYLAGQGGAPEQEQEQDRRYRSLDRWLPAAAVLVPTKELAR